MRAASQPVSAERIREVYWQEMRRPVAQRLPFVAKRATEARLRVPMRRIEFVLASDPNA